MKDFKGTKGKWHVSEYNKTVVMSDRKLEIADVYDGTDSAISEWTDANRLEAEANAQLIAAAPELLQALQSLANGIRERGLAGHLSDYLKHTDTIIAKALGKEAKDVD